MRHEEEVAWQKEHPPWDFAQLERLRAMKALTNPSAADVEWLLERATKAVEDEANLSSTRRMLEQARIAVAESRKMLTVAHDAGARLRQMAIVARLRKLAGNSTVSLWPLELHAFANELEREAGR